MRNPAGYAVTADEGVLLFDLGYGNISALARAGMGLETVSHVFVTHFHPDHWGDLPALLFAYRYTAKPRGKRLTIAGPTGLRDLLGRIRAVSPAHFEPNGYDEEIIELAPGGQLRAGGCTVFCQATGHTPEALAYKVRGPHPGEMFCYTGDALFSPELKEFCADANLIIADAGSPGLPPGHPHMTPEEAASLSATAQIRLSHLSSQSEPQARALTGSLVRPAQDGEVIDVP